MSSEKPPAPLTPEALIELFRQVGINARLAPPDPPVYQAGARIRLPLPRIPTEERAAPTPEAHPSQPPNEITED